MNDPAPSSPAPAGGVDAADLDAVERQLGRRPRGVVEVAHRCPCGEPDVLRTEPRLPDGTPFPTTYYATCPRLTGAVSTLETAGVMKEMTERLGQDEGLAAAYAEAHEQYLARRAELGEVPEIAGVSAGGMPTRVKCLHVLVAHSLAAGPGVNPLGDEALAMLDDWWQPTSCAAVHAAEDAAAAAERVSDGDAEGPQHG
ncbi:DUF501 domain-containing protein [Terrabacter sp. BE26]|uniref:DUF501 domain-containing protein n=1 Tax=Terrabacter sp. BE26 TaxID=2898152 RepID=UPI0035BE8994